MNYKFAKKFFVFYENLQFPSSRPVLEGKFEIIWKNQKTTLLLKKFSFFFAQIFEGYQEVPWWHYQSFSPSHGRGNDENTDPHQSGLKIQILLYKPKWPHFRVRNPWGSVNSHFLTIFHHIRPKKQHRWKIRTTYCLHLLCTRS